MAKCDICGRGPQFGHNVSHSKLHTNRRFDVNVQKATVIVDGQKKRIKVCANCLKTLQKG
jgi:large subunit ribosomal protein L28